MSMLFLGLCLLVLAFALIYTYLMEDSVECVVLFDFNYILYETYINIICVNTRNNQRIIVLCSVLRLKYLN